MSEARFHEVASIFPMMSTAEIDRLAEDIKANGLRESIWLDKPNGLVIDGRNRFMACRRAQVEPRYRVWDGNGSLEAFVVSLNLHRRHLDESQRAIVRAKLEQLRSRGGDRKSDKFKASNEALKVVADSLNVSESSADRARNVLKTGAPELVEAVERGKVSVSAAADIAKAPQEQQREIVARGPREILAAAKQIRAEKMETRRQERVEKLVEISKGNTELTGELGRFPVIYADPPWRYEHCESANREIENQYPTMDLEEICNMRVRDVCTDDAVLLLWATSPKLTEALCVLSRWGFNYRTCIVWDKEKIGMGYWARQQHELLLVATRGNPPTPAPSDRPASVFRIQREEHSKKPEEFYGVIERMFPKLPKLELFCRSPRQGWKAWGNQAQ